MASDDDVQLPDLQVIQRYSLAVRGATARRADVIAALEADLAWLTGGRRRTAAPASTPASVAPLPVGPPVAAKKAPARKAAPVGRKAAPVARKAAPVARKAAPVKKAAAKKKAGARRG